MGNDRTICLNRSVLDFMDQRIDRSSRVLEYGSGWSTRWFAMRCGTLVSVETNAKWAMLVTADLASVGCDWTVRHVDDPGAVEVADMDLVLVDCDERFREGATRAGLRSVKSGGWILFDDAQRSRHANAIRVLNEMGDPVVLKWAPGDVESARPRLTFAWQKP